MLIFTSIVVKYIIKSSSKSIFNVLWHIKNSTYVSKTSLFSISLEPNKIHSYLSACRLIKLSFLATSYIAQLNALYIYSSQRMISNKSQHILIHFPYLTTYLTTYLLSTFLYLEYKLSKFLFFLHQDLSRCYMLFLFEPQCIWLSINLKTDSFY